MKLEDLLRQKKAGILTKWLDLLLESYPEEASRAMKEKKDRFANPVGHAFSQGLEGLYEELLREIVPERIYPYIAEIVRIRAVQDFSPSQALAFIFLIKKAVRGELASEMKQGLVCPQELTVFDSRVDKLALTAFDVYMQCREKVYEIRVNEVKNRTARLLERAGLALNLP